MALPPAQPAYILRGHAAQIHSASFIRSNSRLVTGDADGWVVVWSLDIKRPVAVWRAHEAAILGADAWGDDRLITHGKDNKLIVWKFSSEDEESMSKVLPVDTPPEPRKQPWLLHILHVNTMNFCSFAQSPAHPLSTSESSEELLIAVPNTLSSETVDIFHFPSSKRIHTVPSAPGLKGGMIMAVSLFFHPVTENLMVISGYESGHTCISHLSHPQPIPSSRATVSKMPKHWQTSENTTASTSGIAEDISPSQKEWQTLYLSQPHTQPVLSLDISPSFDYYLTSSADSIIAKHSIPTSSSTSTSTSTSSLPLKTVQTKHSGQQSLQVRNDGKIFATAGWDAKIRVYGSKSMKELAVLKWHKEGCFAVAFADVELEVSNNEEGEKEGEQGKEGKEVIKRLGALSLNQERIRKATRTHWLVAGSKDGKVSLWDIY